MNNRQLQSNAFSFGEFVWWFGVVEDRMDPEKLGRLRVRIYGYHSKATDELPVDRQFWAMPIQPITSAAISGVGTTATGIVEGTTVVGFFADSHQAQVPIIIGSLAGKPTKSVDTREGFRDPNGVYPKYENEEQDTNRLARNEKIDQTIVKTKKESVETAKTALGGSWTEPETPYAAQYPFNHVKETESGHIEEFDDTEGAERIHKYHKAGTFEEIHPDGTTVQKVVKDNYEIIMKDEHVLIKGNCYVTIQGDSKLLINGNAAIEVNGNCTEKIDGNYDLTIGKSWNIKVGVSQTSLTTGVETRKANKIFLN